MEFSAVNRRPTSRETPLGPGAKKDGCFRRLEFGEKQISVNRSDLLAINVTTAFTILNCLEHEFLKGFSPCRDDSSPLRIFSILSNILDLDLDFHSPTTC